ncbi:MAG: DUF63 family protein [Halococcoides sp.]
MYLVLPSGLVVPDPAVAVGLLVGVVVVVAFLLALEPRIDQWTVLGLTPWMVAGGLLHALTQLPTTPYPSVVATLFAAPAVYATVFVLTGGTWIGLIFLATAAGTEDSEAMYLFYVGIGVAVTLAVATVYWGHSLGLQAVWPAVAVAVAIVLTGVVWLLASLRATEAVGRAWLVTPMVVFAHALDGTTTAVGYDVLEATERSPIPRLIMDAAAQLPTAEYVGAGWPFVLLKIAVAVVLAVYLSDFLEDEPVRSNLLYAAIVALGLGPAVNNLVLFVLGG